MPEQKQSKSFLEQTSESKEDAVFSSKFVLLGLGLVFFLSALQAFSLSGMIGLLDEKASLQNSAGSASQFQPSALQANSTGNSLPDITSNLPSQVGGC